LFLLLLNPIKHPAPFVITITTTLFVFFVALFVVI